MRTRVKPCGQGPVTGVYACEATLCAETSHAGSAKRQSQVAMLSGMICIERYTRVQTQSARQGDEGKVTGCCFQRLLFCRIVGFLLLGWPRKTF